METQSLSSSLFSEGGALCTTFCAVGSKAGVAAFRVGWVEAAAAAEVEACGSDLPSLASRASSFSCNLEARRRASRRPWMRASLSTSLEGRLSFAADKVSSLPLLRNDFTHSRPFILGVSGMSHYLRALFSRAHLALGAKARHTRPRLQLLAGGDQGRFAHVFTLEIPWNESLSPCTLLTCSTSTWRQGAPHPSPSPAPCWWGSGSICTRFYT